ncbi:TRAP transporter small permease [Desulfoscipio geothermicus]|uniref:TRAP-type C4-dicarboxylate transport system, small permease component n=1 Tax=Desulfoscipio geothermicus DSM 3669 TaxID=1121426 RepID=A0A1I6DLP6_9FIRM|nr:TRAP transporter small permease [Desulfoscipio geothermicus]SFR06370.1 TRAP-type C4-dicarboxylate transport system, small permease component [Desulfoscipio geothermicus DSM 3669]
MYALSHLANCLEKACKTIIFTLFIVMVITTFAQVIFRFVFFSLSWSEELSRYCLVWLTFVGGALGVRKKIHVAVEAVTLLFPRSLKIAVSRFNYVLLAVLAILLIKYGITVSVLNMQQLSPAMHIPIGLSYAALPVGGLLILIFSLELIFHPERKGGETR